LEELGWNVQRLGTLHDEEDVVIGEVLSSLEEAGETYGGGSSPWANRGGS